MLTTRLHLESWLRVSGALPLSPLYAFVVLTRTSPHSSQLHLLGLVIVCNVIILGFHLCFIGSLMDIRKLQNFFLERKLFPADVAVL
jgi:hypothetical protein